MNVKTDLRRDWPRLAALHGFFFLMGGYGPLLGWLGGSNEIGLFYMVVGLIGTQMMALCVYFAILTGRQILAKMNHMESRSVESST